MIQITKKRHIAYYAMCALCLIIASVFIAVNHTNQPAFIISLMILIKLPFCFALTYVKDREDTALIAMCIGVWVLYETIVITCVTFPTTLILLLGPLGITAKDGEELLDFDVKPTPKNLIAVGLLLHILFIGVLALLPKLMV